MINSNLHWNKFVICAPPLKIRWLSVKYMVLFEEVLTDIYNLVAMCFLFKNVLDSVDMIFPSFATVYKMTVFNFMINYIKHSEHINQFHKQQIGVVEW